MCPISQPHLSYLEQQRQQQQFHFYFRRLNSSSNVEFAIGNITRRVLFFVRDEAQQLSNKMNAKSSAADEDDYYYTQRNKGRSNSDLSTVDGTGSSLSHSIMNGGNDNTGNDVSRIRAVSLHMLIETGGGSLSQSTSYNDMNTINEDEESSNLNDSNVNDNSNVNSANSKSNNNKGKHGSNRLGRDSREFMKKLRHNVIECINELIDEIDTIEGLIAEQVRKKALCHYNL